MSIGAGGGSSVGAGGCLLVGRGGGLSTSAGGGLSISQGGGLSISLGRGLYIGPCDNPYRGNVPPWPIYLAELRRRGMDDVADIIAKARHLND
jgi:hypothetical protein